jgi:hypothetical protein
VTIWKWGTNVNRETKNEQTKNCMEVFCEFNSIGAEEIEQMIYQLVRIAIINATNRVAIETKVIE